MIKLSTKSAYLGLHTIVLIWGFTGVLGKLILLDPLLIVWYRVIIAFIGIFGYLLISNKLNTVNLKEAPKLMLLGVVVAAHWLCFFAAIKASTVSVTLACLSSTTLFVAFLEPLFFRKKLDFKEILLGIMIIAGLITIFKFETKYSLGIILSVTAAMLAAIFGTANGVLIKKHSATSISMYEMLGGAISIAIYLGIDNGFSQIQIPSSIDFVYLLILGGVCTAFAFVVSVQIMKLLTPYTVSMAINLEPIYAIILALIFFGDEEHMSTGFYAGAGIILLAIFINQKLKSNSKLNS